jgi:hypothetical protein
MGVYLDSTIITQRYSPCVEARRLLHDQDIRLLWTGTDEQNGCLRTYKITLHDVARLSEVESIRWPVV